MGKSKKIKSFKKTKKMKNNTGSRQEKIEMTAQKIYEHKKGLKEAKMFLQSKTFHKDRFSL